MDVLSRDDLELLVRQPRSSCVSLYMPTHRSRPETQQDPIRLKNLIRRAEESLVAAGIRRPDASEFSARPELIEDVAFWRHQSDGLALFLRTGWFRCYRLLSVSRRRSWSQTGSTCPRCCPCSPAMVTSSSSR